MMGRAAVSQAFTIGYAASYDKALETPPVHKLGKGSDPGDPDYPGGWVWRAVEDAQAFLDRKSVV